MRSRLKIDCAFNQQRNFQLKGNAAERLEGYKRINRDKLITVPPNGIWGCEARDTIENVAYITDTEGNIAGAIICFSGGLEVANGVLYSFICTKKLVGCKVAANVKVL